jgi:hypothetical protein
MQLAALQDLVRREAAAAAASARWTGGRAAAFATRSHAERAERAGSAAIGLDG